MVQSKKRKTIILIIVVVACFFYLFIKSNNTYTSYESEVEGNIESKVADWKIKVNDTLINNDDSQTIDIDSIQWETNHTRENKASPGSSGIIQITIDPTTTNVSFNYELTVIDQTVDANKILTVTSIENKQGTLEKENNIYRGTMLVKDIEAGKTEQLKIHVKWEDNGEDIVVDPTKDETTSDFIEINFKATQRT